MHNNIRNIQQTLIELVKENLEIFELKTKKPIVIATLGVAEKPLSIIEILERSGLRLEEVEPVLSHCVDKGVVNKIEDNNTLYEFNLQAHKIIAENIRTKIIKASKNVECKLGHINKLMVASQSEYDQFDRLMLKYLNCKLRKMEFIHKFISKKIMLFNFLNDSEVKDSPIKKIDIE
ncbi:MAG: hypothetical protein AB1782_03140 [Cyanobacteriota bacterium]